MRHYSHTHKHPQKTQKKTPRGKPPKNTRGKVWQWILTFLIFLSVQFPQIALNWIHLAENWQNVSTALETVIKKTLR
jgi:hypothetical protein